jgi:hypothetical protein
MRIEASSAARALCAVLVLAGCGAFSVSPERLKAPTAGSIGCPPAEIDISNVNRDSLGNPTAWEARCRGRVFQCSTGSTVACAPTMPAVEADGGAAK